jgi:microcystin-dependent protein
MKKMYLMLAVLAISLGATKMNAQAYIGEIKLFAGSFAPNGWVKCEGQLLSISANQALFSILGTTYGGNGITTFAVPDLRGRAPIHTGQGTGLSNIVLGEAGGAENVTLSVAQLPAHNHTLQATTALGNTSDPSNAVPANTSVLDKEYSTSAANTTMETSTIGSTGNGQAVPTRAPYLGVTYIIATSGVFPQ